MKVIFANDYKKTRNKEIVKIWNMMKMQGELNKNIIRLITEKFGIKERAIYYILKNAAKKLTKA